MKKSIIAVAVVCAMAVCAAGCGSSQVQPSPSAASSVSAEAAASSAPAGLAASSASAGAESKITVSASGSVSLVPDKASVSFGVTTTDPTAENAQSKNSESVKNVIEVLTGRGVEEKSIRTTYYSMYPQYDYSDNGDQSIIGYTVTTTMTVSDQNVDELGKLLSACVDAGINNVDNISFLCSGYDEAYKEALAKAVDAAKVKAEALAAAAGKTLGETYTITEGWQDTSARYGKSMGEMPVYAEEAAMDMASPVLQPGETEITANVTVEYLMQ